MRSRKILHSSSSKQTQSATTQPSTSFLFVVNELPINDEPIQGGVAPRMNENGRWLPPMYSAGFRPQIPGRMFRWTNGHITPADGYQSYNGRGWGPDTELSYYRTTTVFWCNQWTQFLTADGDVSTRNMATAAAPNNRWFPLTFNHEGALSQVNAAVEEQYLAGTDAGWISALGLTSHNNHHAPQSAGLAGNLPTVIALIAFSCQAHELNDVLLHDRAWRRHDWRGHNRAHGRKL